VTNDDPAGEDGLAALARAGDAEAYGALFDIHAQTVYRFCWRRLSQPGLGVDAEDLMSLVFLEAWRVRSRLAVVDGSVRPWLLGVATNVIRNQQRTLRRHRAAMTRLPPDRDTPDSSDDVAARVDAVNEVGALLRALGGLSAREREALELCEFEGIAIEAAANLLSVPKGTVKSRLARARAKLRSHEVGVEATDPAGVSGHEQCEHRRSALGGARWKTTKR
jgi:RNA polymerase sigma-70 factor (ECF subfamily)